MDRIGRLAVVLAGVVVALALLASSHVVMAQSGPCVEDAKKFCSGVKPGGGARLKCLQEHKADLSDACKKHVEEMMAKGHPGQGRARLQACKSDVDKFCAGVKGGQRRILRCLKEHAADLSPECKAQVEIPGAK